MKFLSVALILQTASAFVGVTPFRPATTTTTTTALNDVDPLTTASLIAASFAGASVYTYQNPDTSDKIRSLFDSSSTSTSSSSATRSIVIEEAIETPLPIVPDTPPITESYTPAIPETPPAKSVTPARPVTPPPPMPPPVPDIPVSPAVAATGSQGDKLTSLVKEVANTVEKNRKTQKLVQERKASSTPSKALETTEPTTTPAASTDEGAAVAKTLKKKKKRTFFVKVVKKVVTPWRKWENL